MKILFVTISLLTSSFLTAQDIIVDSLLNIISVETDQDQKVELLNQVANKLRYTDFEEAYRYAQEAESLAEKINNKKGLAESCIILGIIHEKRNLMDSSFFYLNRGLEISKQIDYVDGIIKSLNSIGLYTYYQKDYLTAKKRFLDALTFIDNVEDKELLVMLYNNMAMLNKAIGEYDIAAEYYHEALLVCDEINNLRGAGIISSNLGLLYEKQKKYDQALEQLNKSLDIRRSRNNKRGESYVLNNLGVVYEGMGELEKALTYYELSLVIKKELNLSSGISKIYNNIGIIHKELENHDSALYYYNKSILISRQLNNDASEARTITNIAILDYEKGEYFKAIDNFNRSLVIAEKYGDIEEYIRIYKGLSKSYNALEDYKNAYQNHFLYKEFYDSLYDLTSQKYIEEIEGKYQNIKKEKENQALLQENIIKSEQLRRQIIIGAFIIALTLLSLIILVQVYRSKKRISRINEELLLKNVKIAKQSDELETAYSKLKSLSSFKEDLTNMLVHDLKNPLNIILNADFLPSKEVAEEHISKSASQMLNLVNNVLDVYKYKNARMKLKLDEYSLLKIINTAKDQVSILLKDKNVRIKVAIEQDVRVSVDKEIIERVFVNLLTNAIKFSPDGDKIIISTEIVKSIVEISVRNNGPGIPKELQSSIFDRFHQQESRDSGSTISTGLGLTFCKMAVEAHSGEISVKSEEPIGVIFKFTLPLHGVDKKKEKEMPPVEEVKVLPILSKDEQVEIQSSLDELNDYSLYEVSRIRKSLNEIRQHESLNIQKWAAEVENAIYNGQEEDYRKLIEKR